MVWHLEKFSPRVVHPVPTETWLMFSEERDDLLLRINVRDLLPVHFQLHVAYFFP